MTKLRRKEYVILELLYPGEACEAQWKYGLELVKLSKNRRWLERLWRGTVYVHLHNLEEKRYIQSKEEDETPIEIGLTRRLYRMTSEGRCAYYKRKYLHRKMELGYL